jgi:MoaA/NifB/PqqE/SkfB family radical SAM enzyme
MESPIEPIKTQWATVDEQGRLVLPAEVAATYGLQPGSKLRLEEGSHAFRLHRPLNQLKKVYIEPTSWCNLDCITCVRNIWDEELGRMSDATFEHIYESLRDLDPKPTVFFGGIGEPLSHARVPAWVRRVKDLGCRTELITNGTLLDQKKSRQIIDSGLDVLWVSLDGATPESYGDVRLGAELPKVLDNLMHLRRMRKGSHFPQPEIGIAFVAMRRNIKDLPALLRIGRQVDAKYFNVSNVLPYTAEMNKETLYNRSLKNISFMPSPWMRHLNLPKMDLDKDTTEAFIAALTSGYNVNLAGNNLGGANDVCLFIESGSISIGWLGDISPCLPLLHTHTAYLHGKPRLNRSHTFGRIHQNSIMEVWNSPEYMAYRERVQSFAFAPCTFCGGCEMSEANEEDCFTLPHPACGGCLWAQGVIQCP